MTYLSVINTQDYFDDTYYVSIAPRKRVLHSAFSVFSGSVYRASFTTENVINVTVTGTDLTHGSSTTLSAGEWFVLGDYIYIRLSDSSAPDSSDYIIVTYELYYSTQDQQWYRVPTDSASTLVNWQPFLIRLPSTKQSLSNQLYGFAPIQAQSIEINNSEHTLEAHLESSFYKAIVKGWHQVDSQTTSNISLLFEGYIEKFDWDSDSIKFTVTDINEVFNKEFRSGGTTSDFYLTSEFANVDPNQIGKPKRYVFGYCKGVKCTNIDYSQSNAESDNSAWAVANSGTSSSNYSNDVASLVDFTSAIDSGTTGTGSVTRIYFTDANFVTNFEVGDFILNTPSIGWVIDTTNDGTIMAEFSSTRTQVTAIGANYIDISTAKTVANGLRKNYKSLIPRTRYEKNGVVYTARAFRDYYNKISSGVLYAQFVSGYVATLGSGSAIAYSDPVFADVYGLKVTQYVSSSNEDSIYQVTMNGIDILYNLLITNLKFTSGQISSTFATLSSVTDDRVSFVFPKNVSDSYPTFKELIEDILLTLGLRLYRDNDNKWALRQIIAISTIADTATDDDFEAKSLKATYDYTDILSDVFVQYNRQERSILAGEVDEKFSIVSATSNAVKYLHNITRQKTFTTLHLESSDAQALCNKLSYIFSDRQARYSVNLSKRFLDSLIGDAVTIERDKLPDFSYISGTLRTKNAVVIEINKSPRSISLVLDDQKGLEDNT